MSQLNIFSNSAQVIEKLSECGNKIHLLSKSSPSTIYLEDDDGNQINFAYFGPHIELLEDDIAFPLTISYIINSVKWTCNSIAVVEPSNMAESEYKLSFTCNAVIEKYDDLVGQNLIANIKVVTGVQLQNTNIRMPQAKLSAQRQPMLESAEYSEDSNGAQILSMEDYRSFDVGKINLSEYMSYVIVHFNVKALKYYSHTTNTNTTYFGFEFAANKYIPATVCRFYEKHSVRFIGTSSIIESQIGDDISANIGESTIVTCKSFIERSDNSDIVDQQQLVPQETIKNQENIVKSNANINKAKNIIIRPIFITITEKILLKFNNHSEGDMIAIMKIKHYIGDAEIVKCSVEYEKKELRYITFTYDIVSGKSEDIINLVLRKLIKD